MISQKRNVLATSVWYCKLPVSPVAMLNFICICGSAICTDLSCTCIASEYANVSDYAILYEVCLWILQTVNWIHAAYDGPIKKLYYQHAYVHEPESMIDCRRHVTWHMRFFFRARRCATVVNETEMRCTNITRETNKLWPDRQRPRTYYMRLCGHGILTTSAAHR